MLRVLRVLRMLPLCPLYSRGQEYNKIYKTVKTVLKRCYRMLPHDRTGDTDTATLTPLLHRFYSSFYTAFTGLNGQNRPFTPLLLFYTLLRTVTLLHRRSLPLAVKVTLPPWKTVLFPFPMRGRENAPLILCARSMQY